MPQLPSGRLVALTIEPALGKAKDGHAFFRAVFKVQVNSPDDIDQVVSILYHRPKEGIPYPGEPYLSGITLNAIGTERCDWSNEDIESFRQWLATDNTRQWLRTAYSDMMDAISNSKPVLPENLKGIMDDEDTGPVFNTDDPGPGFNTGCAEEELPESVIDLIANLIKRDTVQSVSFPFNNTKVWRILVEEQLRRANASGLPNQKAFPLSGPDNGLACDPTVWGGNVHIPYEGCCMGDLFVLPEWRNPFRETHSATLSTSYHYLLAQRDFGELKCAIRQDIGDGWFLYESTRPYENADMLDERLLAEFAKRNEQPHQ